MGGGIGRHTNIPTKLCSCLSSLFACKRTSRLCVDTSCMELESWRLMPHEHIVEALHGAMCWGTGPVNQIQQDLVEVAWDIPTGSSSWHVMLVTTSPLQNLRTCNHPILSLAHVGASKCQGCNGVYDCIDLWVKHLLHWICGLFPKNL